MSKCQWPEHHRGGNRSVLPVLAAVLAAIFIASKRHAIAHGAGIAAHVAELAALVLAAGGVLLAVGMVTARLVRGRGLQIRRMRRISVACYGYLPAAIWARITWKWLAANLGASYADRHRKGRVRCPRARIWPDAHGIVARVKPIPGVGRAEFEKHAVHIANAWRCVRVQVSQPRPGRLIVRGLRSDPLTQPLQWGQAEKLEDVGHSGSAPELAGNLRLYVGRDEWGADRHIPLSGTSGIIVGGLPGYGKTSLINSWLMQLAGSDAVQFAVIDGKGSSDYRYWEDRAFISTGDELPAAAAALEDVHALMRTRLATVLELTGYRNGWHQGPSREFPLVLTVIDEAHSFYDESAVKGNREAEAQVRACRALTGQLVKKGRSVMMLTVLATQKADGQAVPTFIRDQCRYSLSFATKTREASVCALGEQIRGYESFCPTTLQDPQYVGVCTASLRTGQDPFVRIRVPEVTEEAAAARAAETALLSRNPIQVPAPLSAPSDLLLEPSRA